MAVRAAVAVVALLAGTAEPLTREDRSLPPALPIPENYNSTLGWPVLDFSGAQLDAPLPTPHSSTRLHKRNISSTMRRRRLQAPDAHQGGLTPLFMGIGTHYAHVYVGRGGSSKELKWQNHQPKLQEEVICAPGRGRHCAQEG